MNLSIFLFLLDWLENSVRKFSFYIYDFIRGFRQIASNYYRLKCIISVYNCDCIF